MARASRFIVVFLILFATVVPTATAASSPTMTSGVSPEGSIALAVYRIRLGNRQGAVSLIDKVIRTHPLNIPANISGLVFKDIFNGIVDDDIKEELLSATALLGIGEYGKAVGVSTWVTGKAPSYAPAFIIKGYALFSNSRYAEALETFEDAVRVGPYHSLAYLGRADAKRILGFSSALEDYSKSIELDSKLVVAYYRRVLLLREGGETDGALKDLRKAIRQNPGFTLAYLTRAQIYLEKEAPDRAIGDFTRALKFAPDLAPAYYGRADAYIATGEALPALEDLSRAIKLEPGWRDAYIKRARIYFIMRAFGKAADDYTRLINIDQTDREALIGRANAYRKAGELERALKDYNSLLTSGSQNAEVYYNRAILHYANKDFKSAFSDLDRYIMLRPDAMEGYFNRATLLWAVGKNLSAREDFTRAIELDTSNPYAYNSRGYINFFEFDEPEAGCEDWRKACSLDECANLKVARAKGFCR